MNFLLPANPTTEQPTSTVTVKTGNDTKNIIVTQAAGAAQLAISLGKLEIEADGGNHTVDITANTDWTATGDAAWCTVTPTSGSGNGTLYLVADANPTAAQRTATITIQAGGTSKTVTVTQAASTTQLTVSDENFMISATGGNYPFSVTSNMEWTVSSDQNWLQASPQTGTGKGFASFEAAANTTTAPRTATISIKAGNLTKTVTVTQAAIKAPYLDVFYDEPPITTTSKAYTFDIISNSDWTANSSHECIALQTTSGSGSGTVSFSISAKPQMQKETTITVQAGNMTKFVTVIFGNTVDDIIIFSDTKFRDYCLSHFDTNGDGNISIKEAASVQAIDCRQNWFQSLQGIEYFTALATLSCSYLDSIDVSNNTNLVELDCSSTVETYEPRMMKHLNAKGCTALRKLSCFGIRLTTLDVSGCTALTTLSCYSNQLASLDVGNTAIERISIIGNNSTELTVIGGSNLKVLSVEWWKLEKLDVSNCPALTELYCSSSQLASLDVSRNTVLRYLNCQYNPFLTTLYLKTGQMISSLNKDGHTNIVYK